VKRGGRECCQAIVGEHFNIAEGVHDCFTCLARSRTGEADACTPLAFFVAHGVCRADLKLQPLYTRLLVVAFVVSVTALLGGRVVVFAVLVDNAPLCMWGQCIVPSLVQSPGVVERAWPTSG